MTPEQEFEKLVELIGKIPHLKSFTLEDAHILARIACFKEYKSGEALITEGEFNHHLLFLIRGVVEVSIGDQILQTYRGSGRIFGEHSFINRSQTSSCASVVAQNDVVVISVAYEDIYSLNDNEYSHFKMNLFRAISEILSQKLLSTNVMAKTKTFLVAG